MPPKRNENHPQSPIIQPSASEASQKNRLKKSQKNRRAPDFWPDLASRSSHHKLDSLHQGSPATCQSKVHPTPLRARRKTTALPGDDLLTSAKKRCIDAGNFKATSCLMLFISRWSSLQSVRCLEQQKRRVQRKNIQELKTRQWSYQPITFLPAFSRPWSSTVILGKAEESGSENGVLMDPQNCLCWVANTWTYYPSSCGAYI